MGLGSRSSLTDGSKGDIPKVIGRLPCCVELHRGYPGSLFLLDLVDMELVGEL